MNEPNVLSFVLHIAGAAALLIWAVRLVRTGVERAFAHEMRRWLQRSSENRAMAAFSGASAAVFLQSATAVAVLVSNFVAKRGLPVAVGLGVLLGADLGSAIASQVLLIRQAFLIPLLLLVGVVLFLRGNSSRLRQSGRILIGLSLIFLSLDMIRDATAPMVESAGTQAVMQYLSRDLLSAFLIGAVFAWAVHSSVAAVLLFVTLAGQSLLPVEGAAAMVLGANLGGAFIAYTLTLAAPASARQMVVANLLLRGSGAALTLLLLRAMPEVLGHLGASPARQAISLHLAFNFALLIFCLPMVGSISSMVSKIVHDKTRDDTELNDVSALTPAALSRPNRAMDCTARELLRMGQKIEQMLRMVVELYDRWDPPAADAIVEQDKMIRKMHFDVKLYLAKLGQSGLDEELVQRSMDLVSISTSLEAASDAISRTMLPLARKLDAEAVTFSESGRDEIHEFFDRVLDNVQLALNVMMNQNPAEARELVEAKEQVRSIEEKLQRNHLDRLRQGLTESIETSSIHQETLRAVKQINTSFSMMGYPILARSGDLLNSRLA
ncbi:MAG: Na/Pi cotransporter family protein [Pseudomonadota bacterium]